MKFDSPLIDGVLLRRYKRFLADVRLAGGETVTAHCPNTGSMLTCSKPGSAVRLTDHDGKGRKLRYTLELVRCGRAWVGVNTHRANGIVAEGIDRGRVAELQGYRSLRREVAYGENSRIDVLLEGNDAPCFVEIKNASLALGRRAYFPDAVSARGAKHMRELAAQVRAGARAVVFFLVHRAGADGIQPADFIDPTYGEALRDAVKAGVEVLAYRAKISRTGTTLGPRLPVDLRPAEDPRVVRGAN